MDLTLACLCDQTVQPDRVILWLAKADEDKLPDQVRVFARRVEIRLCEDIGPYKKLIPALEIFADAFIATADDDLYYPCTWLESLVSGYDGSSIVCRRANRVRDGKIGCLVRGAAGPSEDMLPSSGAGILFPPHSLHPMAIDRRFLSLCPRSDDLWYYYMARLARSRFRKVEVQRENPISWIGSQQFALWNENELHDDAIMANLMIEFADGVAQ